MSTKQGEYSKDQRLEAAVLEPPQGVYGTHHHDISLVQVAC